METITLTFDKSDKVAMSIINMIKESGLFKFVIDDEPNTETVRAIEDARNGKTIKAKDFEDLLMSLNA